MIAESYRHPVLLDAKLHKQYRIRPVTCYRFASHLLSAPIGLNEVVPLSRTCVVVVVKNEQDQLTFHVLMGFEKGENLLLDAKGQWRGGAHVPAFLRRYPFIPIERPGEPETFAVGVDTTCPDFNTTEGQSIFSQYEETPTTVMNQIIAQLQSFNAETQASMKVCKELGEMGLLETQTAMIKLEDSDAQRQLTGIMVVDEKKMLELPDETLARWARSGTLAIIIAHLQSLHNFSNLLPLRAV